MSVTIQRYSVKHWWLHRQCAVLSKSTVIIGLPIFIFQYVNNNKIIFPVLTNPFITIDLLLVPYRQFRSFCHNSSAMSQQLNKMSTQTCLHLPFIEQFLSTDKIKNEISSSLSLPFYCLQACQDVFQDLSSDKTSFFSPSYITQLIVVAPPQFGPLTNAIPSHSPLELIRFSTSVLPVTMEFSLFDEILHLDSKLKMSLSRIV